MQTKKKLILTILIIVVVVISLVVIITYNSAQALYERGNCYYIGSGGPKNIEKAVEYYMRAAKRGHDTAQYVIARCYLNGEGVAKDSLEAVDWYRKAAEQGYDSAQYMMGDLYRLREVGAGLFEKEKEENREKTDTANMYYWYRKAAEQGLPAAQLALGMAYIANRDTTQGVVWCQKAAEPDFDNASPYSILSIANASSSGLMASCCGVVNRVSV